MAEPSKPGVLLDVDGTLLDTNYLHALAWWQAFRDGGVRGITMADTHRAVGIASEELVDRLAGRDLPAVVEAHTARYAALRDQVTAFDRAGDLITACREAGLAVVLATSGQADDLDWMLPAIGISLDDITGAVTSADVATAKPAPDLLTTAMQKHRLDPARTVSIGDTVWDVQASRDAGVSSVVLECGGIPRCRLAEAGADEIYADPADLLEHWTSSRLSALSG